MKAPPSIRHEHERLRVDLAKACSVPGRVGEAAKAAARVMQPHLVREDEYATPPLGLLGDLAQGRTTPDMKAALVLVERLKEEMPRMMEEHRAIRGALERLAEVAREEGHPEQVAFAEALMLHARQEEQVLYPAAILVGEYLKLKLEAMT